MPDQGLQAEDRPARQRLDRAAAAPRGLGRRDHRLAGRARGRTAPFAWRSSSQLRTPNGRSCTNTATPPTRGRTTRAPDRRSGATARRSRHFVAGLGTSGTLLGVGPLPERAQSRGAGLGGRAAHGRDRRRSAQPRRRLHPADIPRARRTGPARPQDDRRAAGFDRVDATARGSRNLRRHLLGRGARGSRQVREFHRTRGRSSSSAATEDGSTCRLAPGPTTWTWSSSGRSGSSTSDDRGSSAVIDAAPRSPRPPCCPATLPG